MPCDSPGDPALLRAAFAFDDDFADQGFSAWAGDAPSAGHPTG